MINKTVIWETKYVDFKPNLIERIVIKIEKSRSTVINDLLPVKGDVLVELACGEGNTLLKLSGRFNKLIGYDIGKHQINNARTKLKKYKYTNILFKNYNLNNGIPLSDETADYIICEASLGYFYDLGFILSEIYRVLRKDGLFIVQVPNYEFLPRRILLLAGKLPRTSSYPGWQDGGALHYFTYETLSNLLKDFGFKVVFTTNSGVLSDIRKIWPELLAGDIIYKAKKVKCPRQA